MIHPQQCAAAEAVRPEFSLTRVVCELGVRVNRGWRLEADPGLLLEHRGI